MHVQIARADRMVQEAGTEVPPEFLPPDGLDNYFMISFEATSRHDDAIAMTELPNGNTVILMPMTRAELNQLRNEIEGAL